MSRRFTEPQSGHRNIGLQFVNRLLIEIAHDGDERRRIDALFAAGEYRRIGDYCRYRRLTIDPDELRAKDRSWRRRALPGVGGQKFLDDIRVFEVGAH